MLLGGLWMEALWSADLLFVEVCRRWMQNKKIIKKKKIIEIFRGGNTSNCFVSQAKSFFGFPSDARLE